MHLIYCNNFQSELFPIFNNRYNIEEYKNEQMNIVKYMLLKATIIVHSPQIKQIK
jgi:hypothetical protein